MLWSSMQYNPLTCHDTMRGSLLMCAKWISSGMDLCIFFPSLSINLLFLVRWVIAVMKQCHLSVALTQHLMPRLRAWLHFQGQFQSLVGKKMQSISKNTFWNKTKHYTGCPLRNVYIMLHEIKTAGYFFVIVPSHSCVLRASAGQEVELQVAEWTCNLQQLNHQQLSDPFLQCKTRTHIYTCTQPFSGANELFERSWLWVL